MKLYRSWNETNNLHAQLWSDDITLQYIKNVMKNK
jgi:hypothetical protein